MNNLKKDYLILKQELLSRKKKDPLLLFEPHPKQVKFIDSVVNSNGKGTNENWAFWANRAGKTDAGCFCDAWLARFEGISGWVVSLDYPSSRDIVQPKLFDNGHVSSGASHPPFIPEREIKEWRAGDQILILKNGAIIGFKSCESGRKKFQGVEKGFIHFDEEPPEDIYEECGIRIGGGQTLRTYGTCTLLPPEGEAGGVSWAFPKLIKRVQNGELKDVSLFQASIYDNPFLVKKEIQKLEAKYPPTSLIGRIRLLGEWLPGLAGALAYPNFNCQVNVVEQDRIFKRHPLVWALDFNVDPMVSIVGQRINGIFKVYKEFVLQPGSIPEMARAFRETYLTHGAEIYVYGDATGEHRTAQTGMSDYRILLNSMHTYGVPISLKIPTVNPRVNDRLNAVNIAMKNEEGRVCVEIDPECKELIADFELVTRDTKGGGIRKVYNKKDAYFNRTHLSDALGYWIVMEAPVADIEDENLDRPSITIVTPGYSWSR